MKTINDQRMMTVVGGTGVNGFMHNFDKQIDFVFFNIFGLMNVIDLRTTINCAVSMPKMSFKRLFFLAVMMRDVQ